MACILFNVHPMNDECRNKNIIIVGATSTIAMALANELFKRGACLFLAGRNPEKMEQLRQLLVQADEKESSTTAPSFVEIDLTDDDSGCGAFFSSLKPSHAPIDVLFYMAAAPVSGDNAATISHAESSENFSVDAVALQDWIRETIPHMKRGSRIIVASSGAGHNGFAGMPAYCGAKFAVEGIIQAAAADMWRKNIWISSIALPSVKTEFSRPHFPAEVYEQFPEPDEVISPFIALLKEEHNAFSGRSVFTHEHWLKNDFATLPPLSRYRTMQPALYPPVRRDLLAQGYTDNVSKVDLGEAPFPPSPKVTDAVTRWMQSPHAQEYPDPQCRDLKEELAKRHNLTPEHVLVGPSSSAVLDWLLDQCVGSGGEAIAGSFCFRVWSWMAQTRGIKLVRYENAAAQHDLMQIAARLSPQTRMIYIDSPSNPMGDVIIEAQWRWFLQRVPKHIWIVIDHAYQDFVVDTQGVNTTTPEWLQDPRILSVRTLSKSHGLAAWRMGYLAAHPKTIQLISGGIIPFSLPTPVQIAALAALQDTDYSSHMLQHYISERQRMREQMDRLGIRYWTGETSFNAIYWPGISAFYDKAKQADIAIPHPDNDAFFITAIRDTNTNDCIMDFLTRHYPKELRV